MASRGAHRFRTPTSFALRSERAVLRFIKLIQASNINKDADGAVNESNELYCAGLRLAIFEFDLRCQLLHRDHVHR